MRQNWTSRGHASDAVVKESPRVSIVDFGNDAVQLTRGPSYDRSMRGGHIYRSTECAAPLAADNALSRDRDTALGGPEHIRRRCATDLRSHRPCLLIAIAIFDHFKVTWQGSDVR